MRNFLWVGIAVSGFCAAAQATVTVNWVVEPGGLYNPAVNPTHVPLAGGRREISVYLVNDNAANEGLGGFQLDYTADKLGATAVGRINSLSSEGLGSRYHTPDWEGESGNLEPFVPVGVIPVAPATLGLYGTVLVAGNPNAPTSLVGWIVVDLAPKPAGATIELRAANVQTFGLFGDNLPSADGTPVVFAYVPEPGVGVLVLAAGGFMCRRRRCMW